LHIAFAPPRRSPTSRPVRIRCFRRCCLSSEHTEGSEILVVRRNKDKRTGSWLSMYQSSFLTAAQKINGRCIGPIRCGQQNCWSCQSMIHPSSEQRGDVGKATVLTPSSFHPWRPRGSSDSRGIP